MPRASVLTVFFASCGLLLGCQGDSPVPSDPGRGLQLTGVCKNAAFSAAATIYVDSSVQNAKLQACKDILNAFKSGDNAGGEKGIDELLVAIYGDYNLQPSLLTPVGATLTQSVANYIGAACGLAGNKLSASECPLPHDQDDPADGIDADDLDAWGAWGPLTSSGSTLATGTLNNGLFAFGVEEASNAFVIVSMRRPTGVQGPCPGNYPNDCQDDVFDVDGDGTFTSITVESCTVFGNQHVHCPEGGACEPGTTTTPLGLVDDDVCELAGYEQTAFWGKVLYQGVRSVAWIYPATPAYAATSSKLNFLSPVANADDDPRRREVNCDVTANYPSGSEGTLCQLLDQGIVIASCTTVAIGDFTSSCTLAQVTDGGDLLVPEDLELLATANKTGTNGAYNDSKLFEIGPSNPERGSSATISFELLPPGGGKGKKNK